MSKRTRRLEAKVEVLRRDVRRIADALELMVDTREQPGPFVRAWDAGATGPADIAAAYGAARQVDAWAGDSYAGTSTREAAAVIVALEETAVAVHAGHDLGAAATWRECDYEVCQAVSASMPYWLVDDGLELER